jgi:phage terminase Nu1 subunit (DNA packaging protein)
VQAASISLLCKRGVLDLKKGREQCIIDYCQNLRDRLQGRATGGTYDLMAERARLSHHQANIEGLKELERRGELVSAHAVALTWQNLIGAARAKLIGMPAKLAPVLLGAIDLHDIEGKLREEIYDALDELAGNGLPPDVEERLHAIERGMAKSADADLEPVGRKKPKAVGRG